MKKLFRGWMYEKYGDYHKNLNPKWSYTPTYLKKIDVVDNFIKFLDTNSKVIDIGCGEGVLVEKWIDKGIDITGIDLNYENNFVRRGDIRNMPYEDSTFDAVLFLDVLEHLEFCDQLDTLVEIKRIMKKAGRMLLIVPNLSHLNSRFRFFLRGDLDRTDDVINHIGERPIHENLNLIKEAGFGITELSGITFSAPFLYRGLICKDAEKYLWLHDIMEPLAKLMPSLAMFNIFKCFKP